METVLIGLPLAGKTTIFNALTGRQAHLSEALGGKKQTNLSEVAVPDSRVDELAALFKPKKKVQATVLFKDLQVDFTEAGGLSSTGLAEMRNSDAITIIVRAFLDDACYCWVKSFWPLMRRGCYPDTVS
ncbi:Ribosome-binding ATPase YchF [subsurface metagenome]